MSYRLREVKCILVRIIGHLKFSNSETVVVVVVVFTVEVVVVFTVEVRATVVEITARLVKIKNHLQVLVELTATEAVFARQYHRIRLSV